MTIPTKDEAKEILEQHVADPYQRFHALMVGTALEHYAQIFGEPQDLWFVTGYLHDLDYNEYPTEHPGPSLTWFQEWHYPAELVHAVEAHADGFNGFTTKPETLLAKALIACDEISGIFYAYQKLNPIPFGEMKVSSILKRLKETKFAPGIDRSHIYQATERLGVPIEEHARNLIQAFSVLDQRS